jgi:hypothetical protein
MATSEHREPPAERSASAVEDAIRQAMEEGRFDDLPGAGRPLPGRGQADPPGWWAQRLLDEEKRRRLAEEESKELEEQVSSIWLIGDEATARSAISALARRVAEVNAGRPSDTRVPDLDPEQLIGEWRAMSAARRRENA